MMAPGPGPHHPMQINQVELQRQQAAQTMAAQEAAKRRSSKPTDKTMPEGVDEIIIGEGVQRYRELRDFERRLDATMTRKRLDIVDSVTRSVKVRIPRLWRSLLQERLHLRPIMQGQRLT